MAYKIVILGDKETGKTRLIEQYARSGTFTTEYKATTIPYTAILEQISPDITDTVVICDIGPCKLDHNDDDTDAFIITVDITNKLTLENIETHIKTIQTNTGGNIPIYIALTKYDLIENRAFENNEYQTAISNLRKRYRNLVIGEYSTSAKTGIGVNEFFKTILRNLRLSKLYPESHDTSKHVPTGDIAKDIPTDTATRQFDDIFTRILTKYHDVIDEEMDAALRRNESLLNNVPTENVEQFKQKIELADNPPLNPQQITNEERTHIINGATENLQKLRDELEEAKRNLRQYLDDQLSDAKKEDSGFQFANTRYAAANKIILAIPPATTLSNLAEIIKLTQVVQQTLRVLQDPTQQLDDYATLIQALSDQRTWGKIVAGAMLTLLGITLLGIFVTASIASFGSIPALSGLTLFLGTTTLVKALAISFAAFSFVTTVGGIILMNKGQPSSIVLAAHGFLQTAENYKSSKEIDQPYLPENQQDFNC